MSRSGYNDECDDYSALNLYRGSVSRAFSGKRGQKLLRDIAEALDAMPEKRLIANSFANSGDACALGAVARMKGIDTTKLEKLAVEATGDSYDEFGSSERLRNTASEVFDCAPCMAAEIFYVNDERSWGAETPEERWQRVRLWVAQEIKEPAP